MIEDDVKLDNQIQIGHNCRIGRHTAIAGCVGIAGSTRIGRNCRIGGAAMISGHLDIPDGTLIVGAATVDRFVDRQARRLHRRVSRSLDHKTWRRIAVECAAARDLARRLRALERGGARRGTRDNNAAGRRKEES